MTAHAETRTLLTRARRQIRRTELRLLLAGMAVFGVRVVRPDGTFVSGRQAVVRTLALPLSFLLLGLGFLGIVLGDKRRALHDVIAGTAVVYSWDARAARLRFLSRN